MYIEKFNKSKVIQFFQNQGQNQEKIQLLEAIRERRLKAKLITQIVEIIQVHSI